MNALDLALANAAANAPKGEELHLENLDSIATGDTPVNPQEYEIRMKNAYSKFDIPSEPSILLNEPDDYNFSFIHTKLVQLVTQGELTKLRLDVLADMITSISTTITTAASMSSEPNHKHRSLHEWDDQYLINELVERENDLMPFYYELLKRIGSPELQSLVMSSMQGKNNSMVTLAQLCAAMGSMSAPQPQEQQRPVDHTLADIYKQLEDSLPPHNKFSRQHREDAIALVEQYKLPVEQRDALSDHDFKAYQSFMNELLHRSTLMERIPNREPTAQEYPFTVMSRVPPQQVVPQQQYFGQATEEYIRQTNNRIGS